MSEVRIVTLGPSNEGQGNTQISAFEEAFGEYSEARGRGRARRKKRRLERIANRKEVRAARREEKKERKVGRQEVKQAAKEARIARRQAAQAARQAKRLAAMQARQEKLYQRKELKLKRKALGDSPEAEMDDQTMIENGSGAPLPPVQDTQQDTGSEQTDSGQTSGEQDGGYVGGNTDSTYGPQGGQSGGGQSGGGYQGSEEEWGGGGYQGPTWGDESEVDEGGQASGDEEYSEEGSEYSEEDSGFDGVSDEDTDGLIALEDTYNEFNDEGSIRLTPGVKDVASKIEWNKELVARLKEKAATNPRMRSEIAYKIDSRMRRIAELENQLSKYQNFEGDFAGEGESFVEYSEARGKRMATPGQKAKRVREVMVAKKGAITERKSVSNQGVKAMAKKFAKSMPPAAAIRKAKQVVAQRKARSYGGDVTPVGMDLNPEFEEQRIEIPADESTMSSATGTGLNGLDLQRDFDAPRARYVELSSNADGDQKPKINWTSVAIGVGVAAVAIWAIRKYKVFK